jgi:hypothetical protein
VQVSCQVAGNSEDARALNRTENGKVCHRQRKKKNFVGCGEGEAVREFRCTTASSQVTLQYAPL